MGRGGRREEIAGLQQEPLYLSVVDVGCRTPMEHDRAGEKAYPQEGGVSVSSAFVF